MNTPTERHLLIGTKAIAKAHHLGDEAIKAHVALEALAKRVDWRLIVIAERSGLPLRMERHCAMPR
jgi:hypothetical protein